MIYEIVSLDKQGNGYLVITLDDGTSFGQNIHHCKVQSVSEMDAFVEDIVSQHQEQEAANGIEIPVAVRSIRGTRVLPRRP